MTRDRRGGRPSGQPASLPRRPLAVGVAGLCAALVGWFMLSSLVAHSDLRTAARETIGFGLGLLIVISIIGAIRNGSRAEHRDG
ncbi:MAG: hypothetical protein JXA67_10045 [Micromonosporaceae bacterium]|nr:hypothetical protein [Micromonosporaceae bacterium]